MAATFTDFAAAVLARRMVRPSTDAKYRRLLTFAATHIGGVQVHKVTRAHVQECLAAAREAGYGPSYVQGLLKFLRLVLREAGNGATDGLRVSVPQADVRAMSDTEATAVERALPADEYGAALRVLLHTGLRVGELLALRGSDWDAGRRQLRVARGSAGPTKSGRHRLVDVPDRVAPLLGGKPGRAFPLCHRRLARVLSRACRKAGVDSFRVHDLRHTRLTRLLLQGVPPLYVSQQAGHSSPAYTMSVYGHLVAAAPDQRRGWANSA